MSAAAKTNYRPLAQLAVVAVVHIKEPQNVREEMDLTVSSGGKNCLFVAFIHQSQFVGRNEWKQTNFDVISASVV